MLFRTVASLTAKSRHRHFYTSLKALVLLVVATANSVRALREDHGHSQALPAGWLQGGSRRLQQRCVHCRSCPWNGGRCRAAVSFGRCTLKCGRAKKLVQQGGLTELYYVPCACFPMIKKCAELAKPLTNRLDASLVGYPTAVDVQQRGYLASSRSEPVVVDNPEDKDAMKCKVDMILPAAWLSDEYKDSRGYKGDAPKDGLVKVNSVYDVIMPEDGVDLAKQFIAQLVCSDKSVKCVEDDDGNSPGDAVAKVALLRRKFKIPSDA